jgi:hypothetical protein
MKKRLSCYILVSCILYLVSCRDAPEFDTISSSPPNEEILQFIKDLGYNDSAIKDIGDSYLVGGDMVFSKKTKLEANPERHTHPSVLQTRQYGMSNYVGFNRQPDITIRVEPALTGFLIPIIEVINAYNAIPNCRLNLRLTNTTDQDILIRNEILFDQFGNRTVCGRADVPSNGRPGSILRLDLDFIGNTNPIFPVLPLINDQVRRLVIHELGHNLGLRHTNWREDGEGRSSNNNTISAAHILGTTNTGDDVQSIMRSNTCGGHVVDFTPQDIIALQFLYPENPPRAGTVPVFRYYNRSASNHLYTTNLNELGDGSNNNYIFEGVAFFAFTTAQAGTVPVFRLYNRNNPEHLFTADVNERNILLRNGWSNEGIAFHTFPVNSNQGLIVNRFIKPGVVKHFYTLNLFEGQDVGLILEGPAFRAF